MRSPTKPLTWFLFCCLLVLALLVHANAQAATTKKQYLPFTVESGETDSNLVALDYAGTIKLARIDSPATGTVTLTAWSGPGNDVTLATAAVSATGTSTLSGLAIPVAGEVRASFKANSADDDDDRTIRLVLITEQ